MSAETNPQSEQLKQKKEDIVAQLKKQNEALGGRAILFIPKEDGSEFIIFGSVIGRETGKTKGYAGGFDDGAVLIEDHVATQLQIGWVVRDRSFESLTRNLPKQSGMLEGSGIEGIQRVDSDESFEKWRISLEAAERLAADKIKKDKADEHYTPLLLAAIGDMPNVLAAGGFDMHAEMRRVQATTDLTPTPAPIETPDAAESTTQFGVAHAVTEDRARMDRESADQAALNAQNTLGHSQ